MAKIEEHQFSGKIGDLVYKSWKGKPYVSQVPKKRSTPPSENQLKRRNYFGVASSLSFSMLKIMVLENAWDKADIDASLPRGKFIKKNFPRILNCGNLSEVKLVPENNLMPVNLVSHNLQQDSLSCVFNIASIPVFCEGISMQGLVQLEEPEGPGYKKSMCFSIVSRDYHVNAGEDITMDISFTSQNTECVKIFKNINVLLNLAFKNLQGEVIQFSESKYI